MKARNEKQKKILAELMAAVILAAGLCLLVGSSGISAGDALAALFGKGTAAEVRIMQQIRLPRVLAAVLTGAALSSAGLIMQTTLNNTMASPSTLGVTHAAVFGANLGIILRSGGYLNLGKNTENMILSADPFTTGVTAFLFAVLSILLILWLCRSQSFTPGTVVLTGIALGAVWTAATAVLQFYSTDAGLSAAVLWSFGDLGRAGYETDGILFLVTMPVLFWFQRNAWNYNALLSGENTATSLGVDVKRLRFVSLLLTSLLTAVSVAFLGTIGFVGIICPHVIKRILGQDHRVTVPGSALTGSLLLLLADTLARSIGGGSALPVGAVTSLLGAPFFILLILNPGQGEKSREEKYKEEKEPLRYPEAGKEAQNDLLSECTEYLSVRNLNFGYCKYNPEVLKKISFDLGRGEIGILLGKNGSGKTTLLKNILGILQSPTGKILLDTEELTALAPAQRAKRVAYVPQEIIFGNLTVFDTVLTGRMDGKGWNPGEEDCRKTAEVLEELGISNLAGRYADRLSGGEKQKVAAARALAGEPKLIVFDEPTGNLDLAGEQLLTEEIRRLAKEKQITVLCSLHNLNEALELGDRFFFLKEGQLQYAGGPELFTEEILEDVYGARVEILEINGRRIVLNGKIQTPVFPDRAE